MSSANRLPPFRHAVRPLVALLHTLLCLTVAGDAAAQAGTANDGLRILSLNIATLSKPDWGNIVAGEIDGGGEVGAAAQADADLILDTFLDYLFDRTITASRQNERVLFAHTEASSATTSFEANANPQLDEGNCVYTGSPYPSTETEEAFFGNGPFRTELQGFRCTKQSEPTKIWQGEQGNSFTSNAPTADYFDLTVVNQCHKLGAQVARFAYGPGDDDWLWVVNSHLSLNPDFAAQAVDDLLSTLEAELAARGEWEDAAVLFVGDFNVTYQGIDTDPKHTIGSTWYQDICSKKNKETGEEESETALRVWESDHILASAFIEARFAEEGFVHMIDPTLPTAPSEAPTRKIDYGFLRNAPAGDWSYAHLYRPEFPEKRDGEVVHWTDHFGVEIVVRPFQADQAWLVTQ